MNCLIQKSLFQKKQSQYGDEWMKVSGKGKVIKDGKEVLAELHWYEANNEKYEIKVKRYLDES